MLRKVVATLLVAMALGMAAAPAGAQTTPAPTPKAVLTPDATDRALLAYGLFVADVQYELGGTDGTVAVTLFGPPQPEMPDQIAAVVWGAEPLRFDQVVVRWSTGQAARSSADLQAALGPRPSGYGQNSVAQIVVAVDFSGFLFGLDEAAREFLRTATWVLEMIVIGLAVLIALVVAVAAMRRTSGRGGRDEYEAWN